LTERSHDRKARAQSGPPSAFRRLAAVTVQPIRLFGDPVLRTAADEVTDFDKELRTLVADLAETMLAAPGSGLAAPQIGVGLRVFTYHIDDAQSGHLINPVLHFPSDEEQDGPEGCLSIPGLSWDCTRKANVVAHGQNMFGDPVTVEGTAVLARCIQHETDHLDGVLFVDRLDAQTRKAAMKQIREASWAGLTPPTVKISPHATRGLAL
jgi:peptide deformylase